MKTCSSSLRRWGYGLTRRCSCRYFRYGIDMLTPSVALALLIGAGSLTLPPWGNAADQRVAQATSLKDAGLDATKVEELDAEARRLPEYAPQQLTIWLAFHQQAADQLGGNLLGGAGEEGLWQ